MIKTLILAFSFLSICGARAQTAADHILQGRVFFEQRNITRAHENFAAALAIAPNDPVANFFYAATRLLVVTKTAEFHAILDRAGVASTNRDVFAWTARLRTDANQIPLFQPGFNAQEGAQFLRSKVLPEVEGAITNLKRIQDQTFLLNLTPDEAFSTARVTMDYGDIILIRAGLEFSRLLLYTVTEWNFDIQAEALRNLYTDETLDIEHFLNRFPDFLKISSLASLESAKDSFKKSIADYLTASFLIRSRPTNVVRVFNLDPAAAEAERQFRTTLGDLDRSLDGRVTLTESPNVSVFADALFKTPKPPRELLPHFAKNNVISGTLPDTSFGNVVLGIELYEIEEELRGLGVNVMPRLIPVRQHNNVIQIEANAPNGQPLFLLQSTDLRIWTPYGFKIATNGLITFAVELTADKGAYFRTSDTPLAPPPDTHRFAPPDEASLTAQNRSYTLTVAGQINPLTLSFPAAGQYTIVLEGASIETGTLSGATRSGDTWTITLTPNEMQQGAQPGVIKLTWTGENAGTWTFTPDLGQAETGTFTLASGNGGTTNGVTDGGNAGNDLTGRVLQFTYPGGSGDKFTFTGATSLEWENNTAVGTYTYDSSTGNIRIELPSRGEVFTATLNQNGSTTVQITFAGGTQIFAGTWSLSFRL